MKKTLFVFWFHEKKHIMNGGASDQDFNKGPLTMALRQYICEYTLSEYLIWKTKYYILIINICKKISK